jgi:Domain of unknown function (DUF4908)
MRVSFAQGHHRIEPGTVRPAGGIAAALILATVWVGSAFAQDSMSEKLSADRVGGIEPGSYIAADTIRFTLDPFGDKYLLRFADGPEVFVLYTDRAALGARVLKYDTGSTALQVSGWGGLTLYTDSDPAGLPAVREGDSTAPQLLTVSLPEIQAAAQDEGQHLAYARQVNLVFVADWDKLAGDTNARTLAFDAMQNAAHGLDRFAARDDARNALGQKVDTVRMVLAKKPAVSLSGKTLVIAFDADLGFAGRSSSRAIARDLSHLLSVRQASN